jgi:sugar phosphate isomerase/epimerase
MENLRRQLDCCVLDCYRIVGPEYFTPPYLPPSMFKRFVVPHVTEMTRLIQSRGGKVRLHCHGKIGRVLDMILDTGCDGIDPCEPPPDGDVELDEVKRKCQSRGVSVWGNLELKLLENGRPDQVRAEVIRIMNQAKEGGGFVLMPTAAPINLPLSPKTEANYRAFIEAGLEFGRY